MSYDFNLFGMYVCLLFVDRVNLSVEAIAKQRSVNVVIVVHNTFYVIACRTFGLDFDLQSFFLVCNHCLVFIPCMLSISKQNVITWHVVACGVYSDWYVFLYVTISGSSWKVYLLDQFI